MPCRADLTAAFLLAAGAALACAAPQHRLDLFAFGAVAALVGGLWRPRAAPAAVAAVVPLYLFPHSIGPVGFTPPEMALAIAWLGAAAHSVRDWLRRAPRMLSWPLTGYDGPLGLFLISALLSLLVSEYLLLSVRELRALILEPVLFLWLLAAMRSTQADRWALGGALAGLIVLAVAALVGVVFHVGGTEAGGVLRAQAWYTSPNNLGLALGRAAPFLLALGLAPESRLKWSGEPVKVDVVRRVAVAGLAVVALALVTSFSIGAWLGSGAGALAVLAALGRRRLAARLAIAAAIVLLLTFGLAALHRLPERLDPTHATSVFRVELWLSSLAMLRDHPILGIGLDNFVYLYQQVYLRPGGAAEPNLSHPHDWILNVWLDLGLLGLVAVLWLLVRFARHALARMRESEGRWLAAGALGCMADTLVHGLIDNSYFVVDLAFLFWLTLAVVGLPARVRGVRETPVARIRAQ